jgi:hypothetical protein
MTENAPVTYGGKSIARLTDRQLAIAETDVANCLLRAYAAPATGAVQLDAQGNAMTDRSRYGVYFARMSDLANAIQAEKGRRA